MIKFIPVLMLCYTFVACDKKPKEQRIEQPLPTVITPAPSDEAADTTLQPKEEIIVRAIGETQNEMAFDQDSLFVSENALVVLTLINEGTDLNVVHNFVLTTAGMYKEVAIIGAKVGSPGNYIPQSEHVFAGTPIALPGQTIKYEFKAPPPGTYDFVCTYPDHWKTMHGKVIVK